MRFAVAILASLCLILLVLNTSEARRPHRKTGRVHPWQKARWGGPAARKGRYRSRGPKMGALAVIRRYKSRLHQNKRKSWQFCAQSCRENCTETRSCMENRCPSLCGSAISEQLCLSNCRVNTCATNSCVTCFQSCRTKTARCDVARCANVCLGRRQWRGRCRSCLVENCPQEEEADDQIREVPEEEPEEEKEEDDEEEEEEQEGEDLGSVLDRLLDIIE